MGDEAKTSFPVDIKSIAKTSTGPKTQSCPYQHLQSSLE